ncbi:hypothetical protein GCM10009819_04980 [Agromyces tropicus]|uniref:Uncharacterized protein n=1 Tax=Agromyces tropicus TaxID=555371 RepID=A0ABN2U0P9_9MICO
MSDLLGFQVAGLPLHILVVHAVVVGVPLVAVALVVIAAWPAARRVLWLPTLIGAVVVLGLTLLAVEAGEWLQARVRETPLIEAHTEQGEDVTPWVVALVAVSAVVGVLAILERSRRRAAADPDVLERADGAARSETTPAPPRSAATMALAIVAIVASAVVGVGAVWTTVRVGEAGSRAVWEGSFSEQPLEDR